MLFFVSRLLLSRSDALGVARHGVQYRKSECTVKRFPIIAANQKIIRLSQRLSGVRFPVHRPFPLLPTENVERFTILPQGLRNITSYLISDSAEDRSSHERSAWRTDAMHAGSLVRAGSVPQRTHWLASLSIRSIQIQEP